MGVKVETLDLGQGERPSWQTIKKLRQCMRTFNPDIVQGWMYHGNIAATVAVFLFDPMRRKVKLFWNVRQTLYDINSEKIQTRWLIVLGRWLSFFPHSIIYNSNLSAEQHCNVGYFLAITGPIIGVKYRLPLEPILTLFVTYFLIGVRPKFLPQLRFIPFLRVKK